MFTYLLDSIRAQELCESRGGGRPGLPVPDSPYDGLCGRKAALDLSMTSIMSRFGRALRRQAGAIKGRRTWVRFQGSRRDQKIKRC